MQALQVCLAWSCNLSSAGTIPAEQLLASVVTWKRTSDAVPCGHVVQQVTPSSTPWSNFMVQVFKNYRLPGRSCFDLCQVNLGAGAWAAWAAPRHHSHVPFSSSFKKIYTLWCLMVFAARVLVVLESPSVEVLALLEMISHGMRHCQTSWMPSQWSPQYAIICHDKHNTITISTALDHC